MIAIDASVVIGHLEPDDPLHQQATELLGDHADAPFVASTLTIAEILVGAARRGTIRETRAALRRIGVLEIGLPADAAERLATLRAETRLRLPDCCVLLAAEEVDADRVLTLDRRLEVVAAERFG